MRFSNYTILKKITNIPFLNKNNLIKTVINETYSL